MTRVEEDKREIGDEKMEGKGWKKDKWGRMQGGSGEETVRTLVAEKWERKKD